MYILNRIIGIVISGIIAYIAYHLDEKAVKKGNYINGWGNAKYTIWSLLLYISFVMLVICLAAFLCS